MCSIVGFGLSHDQSCLARIVNLTTVSNAQDADGASGGIFAVGLTLGGGDRV